MSEPQTMSIEALGSMPRAGQFGDKPGSCKLAVRTVTPEVDPGERMIMKVMICGYGEIGGTKLAVYPSPDSYVPEESSILHGLRRDGTLLKYGRETQEFDPVGAILVLRGLHGLQFVLTYYDGERWQTDKQTVSVQVNNFIQQRPVLLGWRQPNPLPEIR